MHGKMRAMTRTAGLLLALPLACAAPSPPAEPRAPAEPPTTERSASVQAPAPEPPVAAPAPVGFLKGQTHVHTSRSYDAKTPPDQVLSFYAARGYDFVSITDHNRVTVVEPPGELLLIPGVELTQNSASCEPRPAPGYRCLFHTSALFVDPSRDEARGERFSIPYRPVRRAAYTSQLEIAAELGGVGVVNHPLFHFALDAKALAELSREVRLVELFNASLDRQHPGGRERAEARAERLWDDVLSQGVLIHALATDDAHHFGDAEERRRQGKFAYEADQAWIMVRAEKNLAAIQTALVGGDFYSTTGPLLESLERSPSGVKLRIAAEPSRRYNTRFIGSGGRVLAESDAGEASYVVRGGEGYVRAVVEDDRQRKAWVQPWMLEQR